MNALLVGRRIAGFSVLPASILVASVMLVSSAAMFGHGEARAASANVTVGSPTNRFSSNISNISVGDTVTFAWAAGTHVVDLKDVSPDINIDSTHTAGTTMAFNTPGTYYYYCSIHASEELATEAHVQANDAMVGKIVVTAAGSSTQPSTSGATATAGAPATGSGVAGTGGNDLSAFALLGGACLVLAGAATLAAVRKS